MNYLLSMLREILPAAGMLIPLYWFLQKKRFQNAGKTGICYLFSVYLCALYVLVGLPNVTYVRFDLNLNLIPFAGLQDGLRDSILNILLFIPLGMFLALFGGRFRGVRYTVLFGFGISLAIELLQLFTYRATDVNDLITNTLGTLPGFFLGNILRRRIPERWMLEPGDLSVVFGAVFFVMFFLHPLVVMLR